MRACSKILIILLFSNFIFSCKNDRIPDIEIDQEFEQNYHLTSKLLDSVGENKMIRPRLGFNLEDSAIGIITSDFINMYWVKLKNVNEDQYIDKYFNEEQKDILIEISTFFMSKSIQYLYKSSICDNILILNYSEKSYVFDSCSEIYLTMLPDGPECIVERRDGNFRIIGKLNNFYFLREICDY